MPGLLSAEVPAQIAHALEHEAVADPGPLHPHIVGLQEAFEPEVGHDGGHQPLPTQAPGLLHIERNQRHDLIAIDNPAALVNNDQPVRVAVQRQPDVGADLSHLLA